MKQLFTLLTVVILTFTSCKQESKADLQEQLTEYSNEANEAYQSGDTALAKSINKKAEYVKFKLDNYDNDSLFIDTPNSLPIEWVYIILALPLLFGGFKIYKNSYEGKYYVKENFEKILKLRSAGSIFFYITLVVCFVLSFFALQAIAAGIYIMLFTVAASWSKRGL